MKLTSETLKKASTLRRGNSSKKSDDSSDIAVQVTWETLGGSHNAEAVEAFLAKADVADVIDSLEVQTLKVLFLVAVPSHYKIIERAHTLHSHALSLMVYSSKR